MIELADARELGGNRFGLGCIHLHGPRLGAEALPGRGQPVFAASRDGDASARVDEMLGGRETDARGSADDDGVLRGHELLLQEGCRSGSCGSQSPRSNRADRSLQGSPSRKQSSTYPGIDTAILLQ